MEYFKHDNANVETDDIGKGTKIWANAHICKGAKIGDNCVIGEGVYIGPKVIVGNNCKIQNLSLIYEGVEIGNDVFIGPNVVTTNDVRPRAYGDWSDRFRKTIIQDKVAIGAGCVIRCGITLKEGCEIGCGSILTKDTMPWSLYYGSPATYKGASPDTPNVEFNPVLLQFQPRNIKIAIDSIRQNINIPRVWFRAFNEPEVCRQINKFVRETNYSHYIINSDDVVVYKTAIDTVLANAKDYDIFTGWVNMHLEENGKMSSLSNVCFDPITLEGEVPVRSDYPWVNCDEVFKKEGNFRIGSVNFSISSFKRQILLDYPISTYNNSCSSDHHISYRLQKDGIPVYTNANAFCLHIRKGWHSLKQDWLVEKENPSINHETEPSLYNFTGTREYLKRGE